MPLSGSCSMQLPVQPTFSKQSVLLPMTLSSNADRRAAHQRQ
jgi:hypothetical protein